jgi:hypothetical protein
LQFIFTAVYWFQFHGTTLAMTDTYKGMFGKGNGCTLASGDFAECVGLGEPLDSRVGDAALSGFDGELYDLGLHSMTNNLETPCFGRGMMLTLNYCT